MNPSRRLTALPACLASLLLAACNGASYLDALTEAALEADVRIIAHDSTRGRLVGTPEIARVAEWIAERFASLGLEPAGDAGGYFHNFDLIWFSLGEGNRLSVEGWGGERAPGQGWYPLNVSATGSAVGEVVFAGFGVVEPRLGHDDYRGADVAGKIVLVLEREPLVGDPASPFDGLVSSEASRDWRKAIAAAERGAAGILFVRDVHKRAEVADWERAAANYWPVQRRRIETFSLPERLERVTIPGAYVSVEIAERLLAGSGSTLEALAREAEAAGLAGGLGVRELTGARVRLTTAVDRHRVPSRNVVATVRGDDPRLRDEVVIVLGHHDMNGHDGDVIYGGADDNASGTAGVLAIAAAFAAAAKDGVRPRRSVLFMATDAEERGPSLGAWAYTERPIFPLESTVGVFNLDMIGRDQEVPEDPDGRFNGLEVQTAESNSNALNVLGYSRTPALARIVEEANAGIGLTLRFRYDNNESNLLRRSDQWPFLHNGVPALFIHTGLHPDYHTPDDVPDRLNYPKMARIVRLIHQATWDLANGDTRPTVEPMGRRPRS